jgi:hypothetical protein
VALSFPNEPSEGSPNQIIVSRAKLNWKKAVAMVAGGLIVFTGGAALALKISGRTSEEAEPVMQRSGPISPVQVRQPDAMPQVPIGLNSHTGQAVTIACATCHATTTPNPGIRHGDDLVTFHQGLHYQHGAMTCLSCHNADNYDTLRLADGNALAFNESKQLCSQCHGTQARDFEHGAHGGMSGFWDQSRGPRQRNTCTDCHDPHAPKFQPMTPVFAPVNPLLNERLKQKERK